MEKATSLETKFTEKIAALEKELGIKLKAEVTFPIYNIIPDELALALAVIKRHSPQVVIGYEEQK